MKTRFLNLILSGILFMPIIGCKKTTSVANSNANGVGVVDASLNPVSAQPICDYVYDESALTNYGWTKIFEDNFDNDLKKWNIWTGGDAHNELQYYQGDNLKLVDGILQINVRHQDITGNTSELDNTPKNFEFTSGRIDSKMAFCACTTTPKIRVVARIKFAGTYGASNQFMLYGDQWPTQGEIDIAMLRGDDPTRYFSEYFFGSTPANNIVQGSYLINHSTTDLSQCYHVYEMEWTQNALTYYLDGKLLEVKTAGNHVPDLFGKSERIKVGLALGGALYSTINPSQIQNGTMYIDYIKVFSSK